MVKKCLRYIGYNLLAVMCGVLLAGLPFQAMAQLTIPSSQVQTNSLSMEQLQQAAEAGDPDAQYALGYFYYIGKNVAQNTQAALNWIKRASVQGQEQAIVAIQMLAPAPAAVAKASAPPAISGGVSNPNVHSRDAVLIAAREDASPPTISQKGGVPGNYYTIQLLVTSSKTELNRYMQTYSLGKKAHYVTSRRNGRDSYTLLYGSYKAQSEAQTALSKLPPAVKAGKPWIKQVSQVKGRESR